MLGEFLSFPTSPPPFFFLRGGVFFLWMRVMGLANFGGNNSYTGFTPMQAERITDLYRKMRLGA